MSDVETAAILAQKVYENLESTDSNEPVTFGINDRYKVISTSAEFNPSITSGYYGAIILDTQTNTNYLVNRGTEPTSVADLVADVDIVFGGTAGSQFDDANAFLQSYALANSNNPDYIPVTATTGHSLGGYLSQVTGIANDLDVISFASPGAQAALNNLETVGYANQVANYDYSGRMINVIAENDPVGNFGQHLVGSNVQVINLDDQVGQTQDGQMIVAIVNISNFLGWADETAVTIANPLGGVAYTGAKEGAKISYHSMAHYKNEVAGDGETTVTLPSLLAYADNENGDVIHFYGDVATHYQGSGLKHTYYLDADGNLNGVLDSANGTKILLYRDGGNLISKTFDSVHDMSALSVDEQRLALEILYQEYSSQRQAALDLIETNPDITSTAFFADLPQDIQDAIVEELAHAQAVAGEEALHGEIIEGSFGDDSNGGGQGNDTLGAGAENFTPQQLVHIMQYGQKSDQIKSLFQLKALIESDGAFNAGTGTYQLNGYSVTDSVNVHGGTVKVIAFGGTALGYITQYDAGNFQQRVAETVGEDGRTNAAQITLADGLVNQLYRGEPIEISYPDEFVFGYVGGFVGNLIGEQLENGEIAHDILVGSILRTLGRNAGEILDFLAVGENSLSDAVFDPIFGLNGTNQTRASILDDFLGNLQAGVVSVVSNRIVEELGEAIGIDGTIGGAVFEVAAGTVTTGLATETLGMVFQNLPAGVYTGLASHGFNFSTEIYNPAFDPNFDPNFVGPKPANTTIGDVVGLQVANALAGYAGARLAGELIEPESEAAALFGAAGGAIGTYVATTAATAGSNLAGLQAALQLGTAFGPIGVAVGVFIGTVAGTLLGNVIGGSEGTPAAWANVAYDDVTKEYKITQSWEHAGGDEALALSLAQSVLDGVNSILDASGGKLRSGQTAPDLHIGWKEGDYQMSVGNDSVQSFSSAHNMVMQAAFKMLKGFDLVGGHAVVMRAWHNSDATNLTEFKEDIEVAEAFQQYLLDPTAILALMMDQPDSEAAQAWATILQRAAELELHLPHEKDLDGGWNEFLLSQGYDSESIPNIDGDNVVIIDPVTGEETIIHHIIGPGYEIVRIEGTDGNDIIEVIVDGPSISYIDGGAGDDTITGSEQADVIVGGAGDDVIDGLGGNDWLHGGEGNDTIDGGAGEDLVVGGFDDDILNGGADTDHVYGSYGNDIIYGDAGQDFLKGGEGNDTLHANANDWDYLYGEGGDDTLVGYGASYLIGGKGNDVYDLTPAGGDDFVKIYKGDGHDTINGNPGNTVALQFFKHFGADELFFKQSGDDLNILVLGYDQSVTVTNYFHPTDAPRLLLQKHAGSWQADTAQIHQLVALDASLSEQPSGQYNYISDAGMQARSQLYKFTDIWQYVGQGAQLITSGTDGDDSILPGTALAYGEAGDDTFNTMDSNNHLHEYFYGGGGDDTIYGGHGDDHLVGGLGNDHLIGQYDNDVLFGDHGQDHLEGKSGDDKLYGGQGNDTLDAGSGNDIIEAGEGDDIIILDSGNNLAFGQEGNDTVSGGSDDDIVHGGAGNDDITGFHGNDRLYGDDGNDTLTGEDGDDLLVGGEGNDILSGGYGDDVLYGNNGDDLFKYNFAINTNHTDYIYGDAGEDTLALYLTSSEAISNSVLIDILGLNSFIAQNKDKVSYNEVSYTFLGAALVVAGIELIDVYVDNILDQDFLTTNVLSGSNVISGGYNSDYINGGTGDDVISGHDGDDEIYGHAGSDVLNGGNGEDQLFGGDGNDTLVGNEGNDILEGGDGSDELQGNQGLDVLRGEAGNDVLVGNSGEDTLYGGAENDLLSGNEDDDVLHGDDGDDQIDGGSGDDVLNGGAGNDSFLFNVDSEKYISLDGTTNSYLRLDDTSPMPTTEMTIEISFRTTATNNAGLMSYAVDGNDNEIVLYKPHSLDIYIDNYAFQTGLSFNDGQWHDLTVTWEQTSGTVQLFDHGQLIYTDSHYTGTVLNANGILVLGQEQDSVGGGFQSSQSFNGDIRNFAMWGRVLTSSEIVDGVSTADALFGYEFNEDTGNTAYDVVASRDATLLGVQRQATYSTYNNGVDNIYDVSGNDKIVFGSGIDVNDVTFRRIGTSDNLEFSIHGIQAGIIHNQFVVGTLETLEFADGTIIPFTNVSIETIGTENADTLSGIDTGASINESIYGYGGDDILYGASGNDQLYGGDGSDTASYTNAAGAVTADLSSAQASVDGDGGSDGFIDIENLEGSAYADLLTGDDQVNIISGGDGDDIINGGAAADILTGGNGADHFVYEAGVQNHISLNGSTSSYVRLDDTSVMPTTAMTINISFQTTSANKAGIMSYAVSGQYNEIILYNPNSLEIYIDNHSFQTGLSFNDGQWHDLTVTWQQSGLVQLYDHGQLLYSGTNYTGTVLNANGVVILGQEQDALGGGFQSHQAFDGEIGKFAMWDTVLSSSEIADGSSTDNALFAYDFNEGGGSVAQDLVGNRDATLHSTNWISSTVVEEDLDIITDFEKGQDSIDISDILDGAFDPVSDAISDFIHLSSNGTDTTVSVDLDGNGGAHAPTTIAVVQNTTWVSADEMLNNGDVIV